MTGRLESEVNEVLSDKDHVSIEDLENLQYTEQVNITGPKLDMLRGYDCMTLWS